MSVVSLSQPSSRDLLYVKCLCVLSRYHSPAVDVCYIQNVLCVLSSLSHPSSRDLLYVKCLCVFFSLSQPSSIDLLHVNVCVLPRYLSPAVRDLFIW